MQFVKDVQWLNAMVNKKNVRIIDCRFSLTNPTEGREEYRKEHIPGAIFFDLEKDLSGPVKKHGGRHPLPNMKNFLRKVEEAGIDNDTTIITYDNKEGAFAARCWWLFQYIGHANVYVLNGGFQAWKKGNFETAEVVPSYDSKSYSPSFKEDIIATIHDVKKISKGERHIPLIDSRSKERYLGYEEPIDRIPGHIPGAVSFPWTEGIIDGYFLNEEEQEKRFNEFNKNEPVIVYCGSGVTAVPNFIALQEAGFKDVKLYVGSYSDWVSYTENIVSKEG